MPAGLDFFYKIVLLYWILTIKCPAARKVKKYIRYVSSLPICICSIKFHKPFKD